MNVNASPASSSALTFASEIIPASATTVMSASPCSSMQFLEGLQDWDDGGGLGLVALERVNSHGKAAGVGEQTDGDLRLQAPLLGEPRLTETVTGVGLEVQRCHVVQDKRRRTETGVHGRCPGQPLAPVLPGVD